MTQYIKIKLKPGQQKRSDISNWTLSTGEHIWIAEDGILFEPTAPIGAVGPKDPQPSTVYDYMVCTQDDIDELALCAFNNRKDTRINELATDIAEIARALVGIYYAGRTVNVWGPKHFTGSVISFMARLKSLVDTQDADTMEPPIE
jgi:hypothetical protein